ncbi:MAG: hypothetical protein V3U03_06885, partial [Myxococcota bacterium]
AVAIAGRVAVALADAVAGRRGLPGRSGAERRVPAFLALFASGYAAVACASPLVYERYFVVLSPLVTAIFLLDAFALTRIAAARAPLSRWRRPRLAVAWALVAIALASLAPRASDLRGRLAEIARPYRGPLDYAIEQIVAEYARPEDLVIATNYGAHAYMYYLGSHVIVGLSLNNIRHDRELVPDVVIPRRRWPRGLGELKRFLDRAEYRKETLPVRDIHFNNIPALSRSRTTPDRHRFRTPASAGPDDGLEVYLRVVPSGGAE